MPAFSVGRCAAQLVDGGVGTCDMDLAPGPLNAQNNLTPKVRLGASRSEVFTCLEIQNAPVLSLRD